MRGGVRVNLPGCAANKPQRVVVWRVTERCNLGCGFCAYDRGLSFTRAQARREQVERTAQLLMHWSQQRGERLLLSWLGGEPLLVPWLLALSANLSVLARESALEGDFALSLTTNGTRLSDARVRNALLANFAEITVSIDAWGSAHERLRGWHHGFQVLTQSMQHLFKERAEQGSAMRVRINVVLMRDTIADFPALCAMLAQWPISEISFNALGGRDRPAFYANNALCSDDLEACSAMLPALRAQLAAKNIRLVGDENYLNRLKQIANRWALPVRDCQPGQHFLFIDERGRMAPCHFTSDDYGIPLDSIQTLSDLDQALAGFALHQAQRPAHACADCMSTQVSGKFKPPLLIPLPAILEIRA